MTKGRSGDVPRPSRSSEFRLRFATREAQKGWVDLCATARNAAVDAWEFLSKTPTEEGTRCYRLHGDLGVVRINGIDLCRWQFKPTSGGHIWYAVVSDAAKRGGVVLLERVTTGHPNETLGNFR